MSKGAVRGSWGAGSSYISGSVSMWGCGCGTGWGFSRGGLLISLAGRVASMAASASASNWALGLGGGGVGVTMGAVRSVPPSVSHVAGLRVREYSSVGRFLFRRVSQIEKIVIASVTTVIPMAMLLTVSAGIPVLDDRLNSYQALRRLRCLGRALSSWEMAVAWAMAVQTDWSSRSSRLGGRFRAVKRDSGMTSKGMSWQ